MQTGIVPRRSQSERGQTILIVAISLLSLLAIAALAIDVVTLYVARSEIQRAADAAALSAAKGIADSGVTTLPAGDPDLPDAKTLAQNLATTQIQAILTASPPLNLVAGAQPALVGTPTIDWTATNNPRITVTLQSTNLPTFFARIWGRRSVTVNASATAEAYNPANMATFTPIAPRSVKPWLVANAGIPPNPGGLHFVDTTTGAVITDVIGKTFDLTSDCNGLGTPCVLSHDPRAHRFTPRVDYVPAQVAANVANVCPSSCSGSPYEDSIACADANAYAYLNCGGGSSNTTWDNSVNPGGATGASATGAECLIHATAAGAGQGQDTLNDSTLWPSRPMTITAGRPPLFGSLVSTSNSIVTIPIIDATPPFPASGLPLVVVGFLQAFINQVQDGSGGTTPGDINITVLNIAGCSSSHNAATPVVGSVGASPVPVRLITPP